MPYRLVGSFFVSWYTGRRLVMNWEKAQGANKYIGSFVKCGDLFLSLLLFFFTISMDLLFMIQFCAQCMIPPGQGCVTNSSNSMQTKSFWGGQNVVAFRFSCLIYSDQRLVRVHRS